MSRETIATPQAPAAIGPYVQAVHAGGFLFLSGQIALDPASGNFDAAADVSQQTERVMRNLKAVLEAAGSSLSAAVKTTVFLADMNDFGAMNAVYARYFPGDKPARSTVQVARLPREARVEIDLIALAQA
ncbi:MAG: RidA family protein [Terriglobales bacterium]